MSRPSFISLVGFTHDALLLQLHKVISCKYRDRLINYCNVFHKIESIFLVKLVYSNDEQLEFEEEEEDGGQAAAQLSGAAKFAYEHLSRIDVAPCFPKSTREIPAGVICCDLTKTLMGLRMNPSSTLADLFFKSTRGSLPPGFVLLVRYVDRLSLECGLVVEVGEHAQHSTASPFLLLTLCFCALRLQWHPTQCPVFLLTQLHPLPLTFRWQR